MSDARTHESLLKETAVAENVGIGDEGSAFVDRLDNTGWNLARSESFERG